MARKQLLALSICNVGLFIAATMLLPLLPVYAVQLGMDEGTIGIYIALAFGTLSAGALSSGWFSNRFQRRTRTIVVTSALAIPMTFLMGQVSNLILLTLSTMIVWFAAGLVSAMLNILVGMHADPQQRGRIFGIFATSVGLGQVIGGLISGPIVDRWGFAGLYGLAALVWLIPIIGALFVKDKATTRQDAADHPRRASAPMSSVVWLLLIANTLVFITSFGSGLAQTLKMNGLTFDASAISSIASVGGLVGIPLPFLIGWLSDRVGRKVLLIVGYAIFSTVALVIASAFSLWHFWLAAALLSLASGLGSVGNALVTDLTPPESLSTAMSRFSATPFIAGVVGYGATGFIIQQFGLTATLLIGAVLPVFAVLLMLTTRKMVRAVPA
jgi:MFS family permease